jgi:probable rRNA maturation factor
MNKHAPQFELGISVDVNDEDQEAALVDMLQELALDEVVETTLQAARITETVQLALMITDDRTMQALNKQYRHQDKPTDVLSFPMLDTPLVNAPADQLWIPYEAEDEPHDDDAYSGDERAGEFDDQQAGDELDEAAIPAFVSPPELPTNLGDIVLSWPTVQRQAREAGHSAAYELLFLLSHGILHLVGYDDQSEAGYQAMVGIQEYVLQAVGQAK